MKEQNTPILDSEHNPLDTQKLSESLSARYQAIIEKANSIPEIRSTIGTRAKILKYTIWQLRHLRDITDSTEARHRGAELATNSMSKLADNDIKIVFDDGFPQTPQELDTVYADTSLVVINHQAFGLEAIYAYKLTPNDTRIFLKDSLTRIPYLGKGFKSLSPIIIERSKSIITEARNMIGAIREGVGEIQNGGRVLIFPEGTRSTDGSLGDFKNAVDKLITAAKEQDKETVVVITADTFASLPFKIDEMTLKSPNPNKVPIHFYFDTIKIDESTRGNTRSLIKDTMVKRLDESLTKHELALGIK